MSSPQPMPEKLDAAVTQETRQKLESAALLYQANRLDEALGQLELQIQATSDKPSLAALHQARSNIFITGGKFHDAVRAIQDQIANVSDDDERLGLTLAQARLAIAGEDWKGSAAYFEAAIALAKNREQTRDEIRLEKVQALVAHDYELVKSDLDELDRIEAGADWPRAIDIRVAALLNNNQAKEALMWLHNRLSASAALSAHPAAHQVRGDIEMKLGNVEAAIEEYAKASQFPPVANDTRAWGATLMGAFITQQWALVVTVYEEYQKLNADDPSIRVMAAVGYARTGQPQLALLLTDDDAPLPPWLLFLKLQARAEAQLQLRQYEDVLKTTASFAQQQNVTPDFMLGAQLMRVQALNQLKRFSEAEQTATGVLDSFTDSPAAVQGLMPFLRLGMLVQRSLAFFSQNAYVKAHGDLNEAITGFETLRSSAAIKMLEKAPEFATFESSIWYAKGAIFEAERRNDEALNAYNRSFRLEVNSCAAAIARGYALCRVGDFTAAVDSFEVAESRAASANDRAMALTGKGLTFVRLRKFEEAIPTLQAALDVRLVEPETDQAAQVDATAVIFEYLGVAYAELNRNSAALNSFLRAWKLTPKHKRDQDKANLARGISAARLKLDSPAKVLEEWDQLHQQLQNDPKLLFNRALALDATGKRSEAMKSLVRAKRLGSRQAQELLSQLDRPTGLNRWTREWLGVQESATRRTVGAILLIIAGFGMAAPVYQWWLTSKLDWYMLLIPSAVAFLVFALPSLKSIKAAGVELAAEPLAATGRDASTPETFSITAFAVPIAAEPKLFSQSG